MKLYLRTLDGIQKSLVLDVWVVRVSSYVCIKRVKSTCKDRGVSSPSQKKKKEDKIEQTLFTRNNINASV